VRLPVLPAPTEQRRHAVADGLEHDEQRLGAEDRRGLVGLDEADDRADGDDRSCYCEEVRHLGSP
jgi:hypothetical protein